jgi:uncharacterized SAM-binding protein YcdF (DUF218 family)
MKYWISKLMAVLFGMVLGMLLIGYISAGTVYDYQDTFVAETTPKVDVIVCLAGGRGRIRTAGDLWMRYYLKDKTNLPILYISGMGRQANWNTLSQLLDPEVFHVIRPSDVVLETRSSNTVENAQWFASFSNQRNWKRFVLVTSSYHMKRANLILDRVLAQSGNRGYEIQTYSIFQAPFTQDSWKKGMNSIQVTMEEYFKGLYYSFTL